MNFIDILLLLPLILGLVRGFVKGLIHELASLLAIVLGLYFAYNYGDQMADFLSKYFEGSADNLTIAGYVSVFLQVFLALYLLSFVLTKMLKFMALGFVNRILGAIFGFGKSLLLLLLFINLVRPWAINLSEEQKAVKESIVWQKLLQYSALFKDVHPQQNKDENWKDLIPDSVKDSLDTGKIFPL